MKYALLLSLFIFGCSKTTPEINRSLTRSNSTQQKNLGEISKNNVEKPKRLWNDVHTHLSPYTMKTFVDVMDANGVYRTVNMSGGSTPKRRVSTLQASSKFYGRIANFANVDWSDIDEPTFGLRAAKSLREAVNDGFTGLKISKALGLGVKLKDGSYLKIDDPRLDPLWSEAGKLGVVVAIHTADPKAFFEPISENNERYAELSIAPSWSFHGDEFPSRKQLLDARNRVVKKHPKTTFMLLHFANNPEDIDEVRSILESYPNVILDVAARLAEIGRHDPKKVRKLFNDFQNRILFATDLQVGVQVYRDELYLRVTLGSVSKTPPTLDDVSHFYDLHAQFFEAKDRVMEHPIPIQGDWKVRSLGLSDSVKAKLYYKNSERYIFAPWLGRSVAQKLIRKITD